MAHMVEYAVLYMLSYRALSNSLNGHDKKKLDAGFGGVRRALCLQ